MTPLISIIVPIYNTEKYLRRCLHSMYDSKFTNIEMICINDCSSDSSLEILRDCAHRDPRVVVVDLPENRGEGGARNAGLAIAKGKYIGFVDSDDTVDEGFYGALYAEAENSGADMVEAPMCTVDEHNARVRHPEWTWFCSSLFKADFLKRNNILFPAKFSCGEDGVFMTRVLLANPLRQKLHGLYYYNYHLIAGSASRFFSHKKSMDSFSSFCLIFSEIDRYCLDKMHISEHVKNTFIYMLQIFIRQVSYRYADSVMPQAANKLRDMYATHYCFKNIESISTPFETILFSLLRNDDYEGIVSYFRSGKRRLAGELRASLRKSNINNFKKRNEND